MIGSKETSPFATILQHRSIQPDLAMSLSQELKSAGFQVEQVEEHLGPQQAIDWALPALTTLILSAAGAGGALVVKKFFDGFLEELGVKNLGSGAAKSLKGIFDAGAASDLGYYSLADLKRMARKEPHFESPPEIRSDAAADLSKESDLQAPRKKYLHPIRMTLNLGGGDISNPPWSLEFLFTRDIGADFEASLAGIHGLIEHRRLNRDFIWRNFQIKLSDPDRYYEPPFYTTESLSREIIANVDATGGLFLFDKREATWVRIYSGPGGYSVTSILESALSHAKPNNLPSQ
jgi:hypothetical protein